MIAFNAHVDTVGVGERANWKSDPYKALVKGGLVYGLGAGNCKGSMAVQIWLAEEIARRGGPQTGELIFTFVADEENLGPDGMEFLRKSGKRAARRADPGRADREQPDRGRARRDVGASSPPRARPRTPATRRPATTPSCA